MKYCTLATIFFLCLNPLFADSETPQIPTLSLQEAYTKLALEPGSATFTPPANWKFVDPSGLSKYVRMMFMGESSSDFRPSVNLGYDEFSGPLAKFIVKVKKLNHDKGFETKDLGKVKTGAGTAQLIQVDSVSKWGKERQMQAFIQHDGKIWILTCSALKDEFKLSYKAFFDCIKSLSVNPSSEPAK